MNINSKRTLALISIIVMVFSVFVSTAGNINALETPPEEESKTVITGFVTNEETFEAIWEVEVVFYGYYKVEPNEDPAADEKDPVDTRPPEDEYSYMTYTDDKGYYKLEVPTAAGELSFYLKGYEDSVQRLELKTATLWLNVTLKEIPPPPEPDAVLKGVATDEDTGEPIPDIIINLYLYKYPEPDEPTEPKKDTPESNDTASSNTDNTADREYEDSYNYERYWFDAITSAKGLYAVELYGGSYRLSAYMNYNTFEETGAEYYPYYAEIDVEENTTTYYNFTMKPLPPRDAVIKGYLTDSETGKPVENMGVSVYRIYSGEDLIDSTEPVTGGMGVKEGYSDYYYGDDSAYGATDSDGYYKLNLRAGTYMVYTSEIYYYDERGYPEDDDEDMKYVDEAAADGKRGGESSASSSAEEPAIAPGYDDDYYLPQDEYYPFSATVIVDSEETVWLNISLKPIPPKNSKVIGKVTDADTGKALPNAYINLVGYTQGYQNYYWANTDSDGEYEIQVREGFYVMSINYYYYNYEEYEKEEYYKETDGSGGTEEEPRTDSGNGADPGVPSDTEPVPPPAYNEKQYFPYSGSFTVGSSTTVRHNAEIIPYPEEDSTIHGKIADKDTGEALPYVSLRLKIDYNGNEYTKYAMTDTDGEYSVDVPDSTVTIIINSYYAKDHEEYYKEDGNTDTASGGVKGSTDTPPLPPEKEPNYYRYFGYRTVITIDSDEDTTHNIQLEKIPKFTNTVSGTVKDESGSPVKWGWVALIDFEHYMGEYNMFAAQTWTDENGKYILEIYPGEFGLVADRSWLTGVDGTGTHFEMITIKEDSEDVTEDITLYNANNNELDLVYQFDSWQEVDFTATMSLNENSFGFKLYMDRQFGDNDGYVDGDEVEDYVNSWLIPQGFAPFGQLSVDSVTYHPKPGTEASISVIPAEQVRIEDGDKVFVKTNNPFTFRIKMELVPYKPISEKTAEHEVELTLNSYLPAEVTYDIELPSGSTVTGFSDSSGDNEVSGVGEDNVVINAPFDNSAWYNDYGQRAYEETSGGSYDANSDPGMMMGAPEPPMADDGAEGGNKDNTFSQTSDGSGTIKLTVTTPVASDSDTSPLSGIQKVAIASIIIVVIIQAAILMMVLKKRKRSKLPDADERVPAPSEVARKPPTRPIPPGPRTPPSPPLQR